MQNFSSMITNRGIRQGLAPHIPKMGGIGASRKGPMSIRPFADGGNIPHRDNGGIIGGFGDRVMSLFGGGNTASPLAPPSGPTPYGGNTQMAYPPIMQGNPIMGVSPQRPVMQVGGGGFASPGGPGGSGPIASPPTMTSPGNTMMMHPPIMSGPSTGINGGGFAYPGGGMGGGPLQAPPTMGTQRSSPFGYSGNGGMGHPILGGPIQAQYARGGEVDKGFGEEMPVAHKGSQFLAGGTPGRADKVITKAPSGSYIIPADVVAGLGEGNSLAGAKVIDAMLQSGAPKMKRAKGGKIGEHIPVALSHGEYQVSPEHVKMIGHGDLKHGHAVLDKWVQMERQRQIKVLQKLKPPVGAKAA